MKARIYEITQSKYSDSRGSLGFPPVCFSLAGGFLSMGPAPSQDVVEQLFPGRDPRVSPLPASSTAGSRSTAIPPVCSTMAQTESSPLSLHSSASHSAPLCFPPSLLTAGLALAHSPAPQALQAGNKLSLQPLTTSPIHPHHENPEQPLQPISQSWNHIEQAVKIWPVKNNNSVRDRQYYRKIFPIVNICSGCVMLTRWNLIAEGLWEPRNRPSICLFLMSQLSPQ